MKFFECKDYATSLKFQLKQAFNNLEGIQPKLAIFRFDNGESQDTTIYIRQIQRLCNELGVALELYAMTDAIETIKILSRLNNDRSVHGIMCMQPMDQYFSPDEVSAIKVMITPSKDIDCINDYNISKIAMGSSGYFYPATPLGIAFLLAQFGIEVAGKNIVVVGRSLTVGKPMAWMMTNCNATVTLCHSQTTDLATHTKNADIIITCAGTPNLITGDMIKDDVIIIDASINVNEEGKICGDCNFESMMDMEDVIATPVPNGIGAITTVTLMQNLYNAYTENF